MERTSTIRQIAVLGAGVMGAQIAAQFSNAGFKTYLFDLASDKVDPNAIAKKAIHGLKRLKPSPVATHDSLINIVACNYKTSLTELTHCDLIIEAVAERMDIKESVYQTIIPHLKHDAILVTNTSGLAISELAKFLPSDFANRFCGVHFFNPPRYMHLLELIPSTQTNPELLNQLEQFFTRFIGKGVVRAKDTPNFIANRVGVFSLLATLYHAEQYQLSPDEVDLLTGILIGRPKSATFRTMDVVGLDTMAHVVNTMTEQLKDDPWHKFYQLPDWVNQLIEQGALGQKTKKGIYKKVGKNILVWDKSTGDYTKQNSTVSDDVLEIFKDTNIDKRFERLSNSTHPQAAFLWACYRDVFHYCAYHLTDIAQTPRDIDLAIRWGFGWQHGPLEIWQQAGFSSIRSIVSEHIDKNEAMSSAKLPGWLDDISAFYQEGMAYCPEQSEYITRSTLPVYNRQYKTDLVLTEDSLEGQVVQEDDAVRLWTLDGEVGIVSFKSKANCIGSEVLNGLQNAIDYSEAHFNGLVIWQNDPINFSVGANLRQFIHLFDTQKQQELYQAVSDFQKTALRLKYASIPTVAAVRGRALGGGCELLMHCHSAVACQESYIGLVEIGVGLLPAGGGLKELATRASKGAISTLEYFTRLESSFKQVATADVSASGQDAVNKNFLKPATRIIQHREECLLAAIKQVDYLHSLNYVSPIEVSIPALGRDAIARLSMLIVNMAEGGFISDHDKFIAEKIAYVLAGGDVDEGTMVNEAWFLKLEIDAFIELAQTEKTQQRVEHLLKTGRPLRN